MISVAQPADLDGATGKVADRTVAILNRGMPSFNVEADGSLYLSIMRSCSGWPSGVWIDPPRRSTPDGANFQFQHWSHRFEYALVASAGDWREAGIVRLGHEYNNPLTTRVLEGHPGALPATAPLVVVEPASAVMTVLKPAGVAASRMAAIENGCDRWRRHAPVRVVGPPDAGDDPPGVAGPLGRPARTRSNRKRLGRWRRPARRSRCTWTRTRSRRCPRRSSSRTWDPPPVPILASGPRPRSRCSPTTGCTTRAQPRWATSRSRSRSGRHTSTATGLSRCPWSSPRNGSMRLSPGRSR